MNAWHSCIVYSLDLDERMSSTHRTFEEGRKKTLTKNSRGASFLCIILVTMHTGIITLLCLSAHSPDIERYTYRSIDTHTKHQMLEA
ncbi:hypothetical protein FKM82_012831 [Ascaphus truei]